MKSILVSIVAAVVLVGCGKSPETPTAEAPAISIRAAAYQGNIKAIKQHIAAGTDVNAKHDNGVTPLLNAAMGGHTVIAALLIAGGADVNAQDEDGATPLGAAIRRKHTETADLLRKHGGKTNAELIAEGN